jgi:hypothetical protein
MMAAVAVAPLANRVLAARSVIVGTSCLLVAAGAIALLGMRRQSPAARPVAAAG